MDWSVGLYKLTKEANVDKIKGEYDAVGIISVKYKIVVGVINVLVDKCPEIRDIQERQQRKRLNTWQLRQRLKLKEVPTMGKINIPYEVNTKGMNTMEEVYYLL